jgi:hypothetical protein
LGEALNGLLELVGQLAIADEAVALAVEGVFAAPSAQNHFGMVQEIAVDGSFHVLNGERSHAKPVRIGMAGRLARCPLA